MHLKVLQFAYDFRIIKSVLPLHRLLQYAPRVLPLPRLYLQADGEGEDQTVYLLQTSGEISCWVAWDN